MYQLDEFDEILNLEMVKEMSIAAGAGGTSLLASFVTLGLLSGFTDIYSGRAGLPLMSLTMIATGAVAGRVLYNVNHDASMGVVGAVSGFGLASLIKTAISL